MFREKVQFIFKQSIDYIKKLFHFLFFVENFSKSFFSMFWEKVQFILKQSIAFPKNFLSSDVFKF